MIGLKVWDEHGVLLTGIYHEFLKIEGFIDVPANLQGEHRFTYQPASTVSSASTQAVFFAVQSQVIDSYAVPLHIKTTSSGITYYHADERMKYTTMENGIDRAKRVAWRIYYGWING